MQKMDLSDKQMTGVSNAFENCYSMILGYPGTGKTTIAKRIISICTDHHKRVLILGPTGKVVMRIIKDIDDKDKNSVDVMTIHRLICKPVFKKKLLFYDMIIIDEMSMVSNDLLYQFMEMLNDAFKGHIVFIGDTEQLPAIEIGNVLKCLTDSNKIKKVELTEIKRTDNIDLKKAIESIREGKYPANSDAYKFHETNSDDHCKKNMETMLKKLLTTFKFEDIMIMTLKRDNAKEFTKTIRPMINKKETILDINKFYEDDYVMIKKNVYYENECTVRNPNIKDCYKKKDNGKSDCDKNTECSGCDSCKCHGCHICIMLKTKIDLFNGMTGKITKYENHFYTIKISSNEIDDKYKINISDKYISTYAQLSYINTIHKYQGSENKIAIILISESDTMINRNMLYTGVSRASQRCIVIGDKKIYNRSYKYKCDRTSMLHKILSEKFINDDIPYIKNNITNNCNLTKN